MSLTQFDDVQGQALPVDADDAQELACSVIYNLVFFSSCVHATIHILHYFLTPSGAMQHWARAYAKNVGLMYKQVGSLLIDPNPDDDVAMLTGRDGFGASEAIRPILTKLLNMWTQHKILPRKDFFPR